MSIHGGNESQPALGFMTDKDAGEVATVNGPSAVMVSALR